MSTKEGLKQFAEWMRNFAPSDIEDAANQIDEVVTLRTERDALQDKVWELEAELKFLRGATDVLNEVGLESDIKHYSIGQLNDLRAAVAGVAL